MASLGGSMFVLTFLFVFVGLMSSSSEAAIKKYQFDIQVTNVSRLCHAKPIVTVNGRFLGPTVYVREGEILRCSNSLASFRFLWFFHKRKCLLLREKVSGAMDELELGWPWSLEYWK
ncbi:Laccase-11 [Glycine max]|nr:Laccase-11 [Glycine max]